jgi:hypothetical protein
VDKSGHRELSKMSCDCCGAGRVEMNTCKGEGSVTKAAEEQEEDVVGSRVSEVSVFPSSACGDDVGETKCRLFWSETLRFINTLYLSIYVVCRIISSRSSNSIHIRFALIFRFSCGSRSILVHVR